VHGEPMPITDLEVGPDGNIYFTTGGGPGQGGLYKVTWTGAKPQPPDMSGILGVVRQPQPLSTWGWAAIERAKASMGASFGGELEKLARNGSAAPPDRMRAVLEMQRHGVPPGADLLKALVKDKSADVRAAAVYVAGVQTDAAAKSIAATALKDGDPVVQRRAAEALVRQGLTPASPRTAPVADLYALLKSGDRFVRYAGRLALEHTPRTEWIPLVMAETNVVPLTEGLVAIANTADESQATLGPVFEKLVGLMQRPGLSTADRIRVLRAFEVAASQTPKGVAPSIRKQVYAALAKQLPAAPPAGTWVECTNGTGAAEPCAQYLHAHHVAKVLAYTGEPGAVASVLAIAPKGDGDQPGQIDLMYSLMNIDRGWTSDQKQRAIDWFARASRWRGGSTFAGHVNNIFDATIDAFTEDEKQLAYKSAPLFAPITEELAAQMAADAARGGGAGRRGRGPSVPLDRQERYDNLVFPRGGPAGSLVGRGGAPSLADGERVFRDTCAQCHRFGTTGAAYAPDLTSIADRLPRRDVLRAIFFPNEKVDAKYVTTVVVKKDGTTVRGLVVTENAQTLALKTATDAEPVTVAKGEIAKRTTERVSIMPEDLADKVTDNGVRDVTVYLLSKPAK
jgi:putative heme-binding domain-containing protein